MDAYGRESICFSENNIKVTIPFNRIKYAGDASVDVPVEKNNAPVNVPVNTSDAPVEASDVSEVDRILAFFIVPRGTLEIAEMLGYKDKRSVRKRLSPLLDQGRIAMTIPDKPNSRMIAIIMLLAGMIKSRISHD